MRGICEWIPRTETARGKYRREAPNGISEGILGNNAYRQYGIYSKSLLNPCTKVNEVTCQSQVVTIRGREPKGRAGVTEGSGRKVGRWVRTRPKYGLGLYRRLYTLSQMCEDSAQCPFCRSSTTHSMLKPSQVGIDVLKDATFNRSNIQGQ